MKYRIGIDIGGTKVNIGFLDTKRCLCFKHTFPVPEDKRCENVVIYISKVLKDFMRENLISDNDIISVGIGIPGTVSADKKCVINAPNLNWKNINIAQLFKKHTGFSATVIQDSRACAFGEYISGNAVGSQVLLSITLGTGIGTGLVINGKIFDGFLQSAGELGHIPVFENGRKCGCGKLGCAECYCAGKGLDETAREIFGETATAKTLFEKAENGDSIALEKIAEAVEILGKVIVSAINLISPDCLIFSGGLSLQEKLYLNPLIEYIKAHSYSDNSKSISIKTAFWKEDAPMIGAALYGEENRKPYLSASIMCGNMLNLSESLKACEEANIDYIHFDVMDGHFVPNLMLPLIMANDIRKATNIPLDIHLMVENPHKYIDEIELCADDIVTVHYESTPHIQSALSLIKKKGAKAGLAINPGTSLSAVEDLLYDIDVLLVMTVNPGFAGQKIVPSSFNKIKKIKKYLSDNNLFNIKIQVDGNCSFENVPKLFECGADIFVVGSSSVFSPEYTIISASEKLISSCKEEN